jgi:hypothetical protein
MPRKTQLLGRALNGRRIRNPEVIFRIPYNTQIARLLGNAPGTVKLHVTAILKR